MFLSGDFDKRSLATLRQREVELGVVRGGTGGLILIGGKSRKKRMDLLDRDKAFTSDRKAVKTFPFGLACGEDVFFPC